MKQNYLKKLMTALLLLCCTAASAQSFEVDGIYYKILSEEDKTVEVRSGSNEYTGAVTIPASVTYNGEAYSVKSIGNNAFRRWHGLTSIEIPSSVTSIGSSAFYDCAALTSIEIPASVTSIGNSAFNRCAGLTSIVIPSSITSIGNYAFAYCTGLTSIVVDEGNTIYDSRGNCNAIIKTASNTLILGCKNTIIPEGVTSIGNHAFHDCTSLTSIVIPEGVTSIGAAAFFGCDGLTSIEIPASVTSIGDYVFYSCDGLTSVVIPEGVTSIGNNAFNGCTGLTSIVVDEGNTVYDSRGNCNAIIETASNTLIVGCKNTIIPSGVASIGSGAFEDCDALTSIEIPASVTSIGYAAFSGCSGLTSVEIPSSVTSIGIWAFWGCTGLTSITSHIAAENLFAPGNNAFSRVNKSACTLYVPAGAKEAYAAMEQWKDFKNIVELEPEGHSLAVSAAR